jgi:hypothetical protein
VLGPGPPPGNFDKFYRFLRFFTIFGPSIEPEKLSLKSASTANPPSKVKFMGILLIRDPISSSWLNNYDSYFSSGIVLPLSFLVLNMSLALIT